MDEVRIFKNTAALFADAAERIIDLSREAIEINGRFTIALSGGNTPNGLYSLLSDPEYKSRIDFSKWYVCWGDERMLPATDPKNNSYQATTKLLDHAGIPANQVFPVPVHLDPVAAVRA